MSNHYKPFLKSSFNAQEKTFVSRLNRLRFFHDRRVRRFLRWRKGFLGRHLRGIHSLRWYKLRYRFGLKFFNFSTKKRRKMRFFRQRSLYKIGIDRKKNFLSFYRKIDETKVRTWFKHHYHKTKFFKVENLFRMFENRLDVLSFRLKLFPTIFLANIFIKNQGLLVNYKETKNPSTLLQIGDLLSFKNSVLWSFFSTRFEDQLWKRWHRFHELNINRKKTRLLVFRKYLKKDFNLVSTEKKNKVLQEVKSLNISWKTFLAKKIYSNNKFGKSKNLQIIKNYDLIFLPIKPGQNKLLKQYYNFIFQLNNLKENKKIKKNFLAFLIKNFVVQQYKKSKLDLFDQNKKLSFLYKRFLSKFFKRNNFVDVLIHSKWQINLFKFYKQFNLKDLSSNSLIKKGFLPQKKFNALTFNQKKNSSLIFYDRLDSIFDVFQHFSNLFLPFLQFYRFLKKFFKVMFFQFFQNGIFFRFFFLRLWTNFRQYQKTFLSFYLPLVKILKYVAIFNSLSKKDFFKNSFGLKSLYLRIFQQKFLIWSTLKTKLQFSFQNFQLFFRQLKQFLNTFCFYQSLYTMDKNSKNFLLQLEDYSYGALEEQTLLQAFKSDLNFQIFYQLKFDGDFDLFLSFIQQNLTVKNTLTSDLVQELHRLAYYFTQNLLVDNMVAEHFNLKKINIQSIDFLEKKSLFVKFRSLFLDIALTKSFDLLDEEEEEESLPKIKNPHFFLESQDYFTFNRYPFDSAKLQQNYFKYKLFDYLKDKKITSPKTFSKINWALTKPRSFTSNHLFLKSLSKFRMSTFFYKKFVKRSVYVIKRHIRNRKVRKFFNLRWLKVKKKLFQNFYLYLQKYKVGSYPILTGKFWKKWLHQSFFVDQSLVNKKFFSKLIKTNINKNDFIKTNIGSLPKKLTKKNKWKINRLKKYISNNRSIQKESLLFLNANNFQFNLLKSYKKRIGLHKFLLKKKKFKKVKFFDKKKKQRNLLHDKLIKLILLKNSQIFFRKESLDKKTVMKIMHKLNAFLSLTKKNFYGNWKLFNRFLILKKRFKKILKFFTSNSDKKYVNVFKEVLLFTSKYKKFNFLKKKRNPLGKLRYALTSSHLYLKNKNRKIRKHYFWYKKHLYKVKSLNRNYFLTKRKKKLSAFRVILSKKKYLRKKYKKKKWKIIKASWRIFALDIPQNLKKANKKSKVKDSIRKRLMKAYLKGKKRKKYFLKRFQSINFKYNFLKNNKILSEYTYSGKNLERIWKKKFFSKRRKKFFYKLDFFKYLGEPMKKNYNRKPKKKYSDLQVNLKFKMNTWENIDQLFLYENKESFIMNYKQCFNILQKSKKVTNYRNLSIYYELNLSHMWQKEFFTKNFNTVDPLVNISQQVHNQFLKKKIEQNLYYENSLKILKDFSVKDSFIRTQKRYQKSAKIIQLTSKNRKKLLFQKLVNRSLHNYFTRNKLRRYKTFFIYHSKYLKKTIFRQNYNMRSKLLKLNLIKLRKKRKFYNIKSKPFLLLPKHIETDFVTFRNLIISFPNMEGTIFSGASNSYFYSFISHYRRLGV